MTTNSAQYTVTAITDLLSDKQLLNGRVQYQPFAQYQLPIDSQQIDTLHTGIVTTVHNHPLHGLMVRIQPDANTLDLVVAWYVLKLHVKGWAHIETEEIPAPIAATVAAVIEAPVAVEAPIAAQPAHMTDAGRFSGKVGDVYAGYGYINETGGGSIRFLTRNVLAGVTLQKGMAVTYTTGAYTDCALTIVVTGHAASEAAYTRIMDRKATEAAAKQPAKDRAALRKARYAADLAARAAKDKASMLAAMDAVLNL